MELGTEKIKKNLIKYKRILVPTASGVIAALVVTLVLVPQVLSYFSTNQEIAKVSSQAVVLEIKAEELEGLDSSNFDAGLKTVSAVLPSDPDIPSAIVHLEDLISKSGLRLNQIEYLPSNAAQTNNFRLVIKAGGSLTSIRSFLLSLRNAPRIYQIETITLHKGSESTDVEIPITVYFGEIKSRSVSPADPFSPLTDSEQELLSQLVSATSYRVNIDPTQATASAATPGVFVPVVDVSSVPLGKIDPFE